MSYRILHIPTASFLHYFPVMLTQSGSLRIREFRSAKAANDYLELNIAFMHIQDGILLRDFFIIDTPYAVNKNELEIVEMPDV